MTSLRIHDGKARLELPTEPCSVCKKPFVKFNTMQQVCGLRCAQRVPVIARNTLKAQAKAEREDFKRRKDAVKTRSDWIKGAQVEFNRYIRIRDAGKPCICCGAALGRSEAVGGDFDCGHYRSIGSAPHLRFHEDNAHGQTKKCNRYGAGRAVDYRIGLIARIGRTAVEALESDNSSPKWSIEDLKSIRDRFRARAKELQKGRE